MDNTLTITVGNGGDIGGDTETAVQAAADYIAAAGGGTVHILPGRYVFSNAVYLRSNVRFLGSGPETLILKNLCHESALTIDSDWYESEITLASPAGFDYGCGIALQADTPHNNGQNIVKRTIIGRDGNRFLLDKPLEKNFWADHEAVARTLFPLFSGDHIRDVKIENLRLDGNKEENPNFNGNYGGCIFMQDCEKIEIRNVETVNYNGDGISWQICHDVAIEDCLSEGNADLGFHPGSGSQRPVVRNCKSIDNGIGLFFCWGVRNGVVENSEITGSSKYGISIGHRDNDNLVRGNLIADSGKTGIFFREESGGRDPHRNRFEDNLVRNVGDFGVDIKGKPEGTVFLRNRFEQNAKTGRGTGMRIGAHVPDLSLEENTFEGFETETEDLRV